MSGPKGIQYTVEQLAQLQEARDVGQQSSRLRVAERDLAYLREDCARFTESYGVSVELDRAPESATKGMNSVALARLADEIESLEASGRRRLVSAVDQARTQRLVERMLELHPERPKLTKASAESPAARTDPTILLNTMSIQVSEALAQLDAGVILSDEFTHLAMELGAPGSTADGSLLRALQAEVVRLNRDNRATTEILGALHDLDVRVGALQPEFAATANAMVTAAIFAARSAEAVNLSAIIAAVDEAEQLALAAANRTYVRSKLDEILVSLGYQGAPGFETVIPLNGRLVRKPGWSQHGVLVDVANDEISLTVVRTATETDAALSGARDVQAETEMCDDLPSILHDIEASGIRTGRVRDIPPGIFPVRVLDNAAPAPTAEVRRARPKEREL